MVERVARATLTNVVTFIDGVIDAPGLRPARDCRYGHIRLYITESFSFELAHSLFYYAALGSLNVLRMSKVCLCQAFSK